MKCKQKTQIWGQVYVMTEVCISNLPLLERYFPSDFSQNMGNYILPLAHLCQLYVSMFLPTVTGM